LKEIIVTEQLTKKYREVTAVNGLSIHVNRGEIYAFLGLNGAGKTTTIRTILGMVKPTAGRVYVLGKKIRIGGEKPWGSVGYLVETPHAYPELTVWENLEIMRRLRPGTGSQAISQVIELLSLAPYANRRAGTLSLGNAQRLGLAKALLHNPALLVLDEPAHGLDPAGIVEIRELLTRLAIDQGVTVFLSSHHLGEVTRLAHRIGIIHHGQLLQELDIEMLEHNRQKHLLVNTRNQEAAKNTLLMAGHSPNFTPDGSLKVTEAAAVERPEDIATLLVQAGHPPTLLKVEQEDLEQYFLRLIRPSEGKTK